MRILILHSDVTGDEQPTRQAQDLSNRVGAVEKALSAGGHQVFCAPFYNDEQNLREAIAWAAAQTIFNLVENVAEEPAGAHKAPRLFDVINIRYTGARADAMQITANRITTNQLLRERALPAPGIAMPPDWQGLDNGKVYILKSVCEAGSFGLDDASVARGWDIPDRARSVAQQYGDGWFAEDYLAGREFQICLLANIGGVHVLPIAELCFSNWAEHRPQIAGYRAKWDAAAADAMNIVLRFGLERDEPELAARLTALSRNAWGVVGLSGYARIDFRLDTDGSPVIIGVNANPRLSPDNGFAEAAWRAGLSFPRLIERIAEAAMDC